MAAVHRWTPFLGAFAHIDATIDAAVGGVGAREAFRRERDRIVDALRAAADDSVAAEEIGALLDAAMAESLVTLRDAVPAFEVKRALASGEVLATLSELMNGRASVRVRGLAGDVALAWRAGFVEDLATAWAAMDVLHGVGGASPKSPPTPPMVSDASGYGDNLATKKQAEIVPEKKHACLKKPAIMSSCDAKRQADMVPEKKKQADLKKPATMGSSCDAKKRAEIVREKKKQPVSYPKKSVLRKADHPVFGCVRVKASACTGASTQAPLPPKNSLRPIGGGAGEKRMAMMVPPTRPSRAEETKMEATKRKLHERYQEAEDTKRRRTIRVIKAPLLDTKNQIQGNTTQPAVARGRAPCASEKRSVVSSIPWRRV